MGKELLLGFRSQGWWINSWFALANAPSMWRIETVTECIVTRYPIAAFADLVSSNPPIMMQLLASQSYELVILSRLIVDFAEAPAVPGRLLMMPVPKQ